MSLKTSNSLENLRIGIAITGSFCTFASAFQQISALKEAGATLYPIVSDHAASIDSRFGKAADQMQKITDICGRSPVTTIAQAEPFGPSIPLDIMVILPCTGNTIGKLSHAITDTPVLMAAKAHLRNQRPLVLAMASNDALGFNLQNIGILMNSKNIYFVPFGQDDPVKKPNSMISHLDRLHDTILQALNGTQLQPVIVSPFS